MSHELGQGLAACTGSYVSWLAGDNLAPAANAPLGTVGGRLPGLKQRVSGFAANGGAATLAVRKVADALKVRLGPSLQPLQAMTLTLTSWYCLAVS